MEFEEIAIVGLAAQLPSGLLSSTDFDYASFWDFLLTGGKAYEPLENILPDFVRASTVKLPAQGSFLKNVTSFDNISLGISTKDARMTPYGARRLLDLSFQALQDSGIDTRRRNIGCFMSGNMPGNMGAPGALEKGIDAEGSFSGTPYSMANRISYALDLTGPSLQLDTACSSSLTALHLAATAIRQGDCEAALVGAAQINRELPDWTIYAQAGISSADGMSRPLDAEAAGFGRGEAAIVVVLKPLKDAVRDHDYIYSTVLGSAIKATGSRMPLYVPNGVVQEECIHRAYERSGLRPSDADYVELHATGTSVGDPIEANVSGRLFAKDRPEDGPVVLGAVKGNVGHLEVAAFLAALVKACLIFEHGTIPPSVNFSKPATTINWEAFDVTVPVQPIPLSCRSSSGRSIISISSFGIGGSMGHVVVRAPPSPQAIPTTAEVATMAPILFLIGGLSSSAVDDISHSVLELAADDHKILRNCAVTLSRRARQLPWRRFFTIPPSPSPTADAATIIPREPFRLAYVFSGQGPQHLEMGRQLFAEYPVFRNTVLEMDNVYRRVTGTSLIESTGLFAPSTSPTIKLPDVWPTIFSASAIAMVQIALCDLLKSVGIVPDMVVGHSAGETAAVYASGAGPKAMAMEIAIARGQSLSLTESNEVGMMSLGCDATRAGELIASVAANDTGILELSCFNAPDSVSVSGTACLLDKLVDLAKQRNILAQRIRVIMASHCSLMDAIKSDYLARMTDIFARYPGSHVPKIPVYATCREDRFVDAFSPSYFWDNCRHPVLFDKAVSDMQSASPIFMEVACHPVLAPFILAQGAVDSRVLCPMRRASGKTKPSVSLNESTLFLTTLGRLSLLGSNSLDLSGLYGASAYKSKLVEHILTPRAIPSPKVLSSQGNIRMMEGRGPLSSANLRMNNDTHPTLGEHVINGEPILPTAAFIEMLLESGATSLREVELVSILSLAGTAPLEVSVQRLKTAWAITTGVGSREREHARGFMETSTPMEPPVAIDIEPIFKRLPMLDSDGFYPSLQPLAVFGPHFQRTVRCHGGPSEVIAEIEGLRADELADGYLLHPAIMDACIHFTFHPDLSRQHSKDTIYLPSAIENFIFYRPGQNSTTGNWYSHITLRQWTPDTRSYDILITDSSGLALAEIRNLRVRKFMPGGGTTVERRFELVFQPLLSSDSADPSLTLDFPFLAHKPLSSAAPASDDLHHIYPYTFGQETNLQQQLKEIDTSVSTTIYVLAIHGRDADAALGLCAVLKREIPSWDIRLAIFESCVDFSNPTPLLTQHMGAFSDGEKVISFGEDGAAHVLRAVLSSPSSVKRQGLLNGNAEPGGTDPRASRSSAPPFCSDRTYILLGGIGGLGVDLAVWLYEHGARNLVLTSRRGIDSLDTAKDATALAKVAYLEGRHELTLRLEKCDATDVEQMGALLRTLPAPLAGCFCMTMVRSDALFLDQTPDGFRAVYDSKVRVFETFTELVEIQRLDFVVAISSFSSLVGAPGQANYASACTALDGAMSRYLNAFSLIAPSILDAGYLERTGSAVVDRCPNCSAEALWVFLEDALRKMDESPFTRYIPDVARPPGDQTVVPSVPHAAISSKVPREEVLRRVLVLLEVQAADFDAEQPLTTYGLDSIGAARLASILRPFGTFSQLQLLGGITWSEMESELNYSTQSDDVQGESDNPATTILLGILGVSPDNFSPDVPLSTYGMDLPVATQVSVALETVITVTAMQLMSEMSWADLLAVAEAEQLSQPLVQICHGPKSGPPLIILPGGNGSIGVFYSLQAHYEGELWGVQLTESTPMESFMGLVTFWKELICSKWPHGPYRIAAFCGSAVHSVALVKMLEDAGEEVLQLTFIDHSPTLIFQLEEMFRDPWAVDYDTFRTTLVLDFLHSDPIIGAPLLANYEAAAHDPAAEISARLGFNFEKAWIPILFEFLHSFYTRGIDKSPDSFIRPFDEWVSSVKAGMAVLVAERGAATSPLLGRWPDLGASLVSKPVRVDYISGVGHFGIFGDARAARLLMHPFS
ncbi:hypothetical protein GGX14DRAFT_677404 [Mycena pura]|uniref:Polyketide synthase n=1 Tax=Mycena pura TaxID=153505 RepID=A0AAD6UV33_9AGAR|nr:hypothetical protein GGX14DRAFT_677404 [Mycena pura]